MGASENLTILLTDIVNYTQITAAQSRAQAAGMLRRHDELLLPIVQAYRGRKIKSIGDAMLITFRSPTDAVHCGMALQDALAEARRDREGFAELHIRVAINLGEVRIERQDIYGEPVNVTSRLEGITPPDEVYFTEAVYLAMNKAEVSSESLGQRRLKGVPEPVQVYRVPPFQYSRLVPSGKVAESTQGLPYAGAHTRRKPVRRGLFGPRRLWSALRLGCLRGLERGERLGPFQRWLILTGFVLGLLLLMNWIQTGLRPSLPVVEEALGELTATLSGQRAGADGIDVRWPALVAGEQDLGAGRLAAVQERIDERLAARAGDAQALVLSGHLAYVREQREQGLAAYAQALAQTPDLGANARLAQNLVDSLGWISREARPLILRHASDAMLAALARRTGQAGYHGRSQAADILRELGRADLIDHYNYALEELRGRSECEDRLVAVRQLRDLGKPQAIPALEAAMGDGIRGWWANRCLRGEAREAIEYLRGLEESTGR